MLKRVRSWLFLVLHEAPPDNLASRRVNVAIMTIIVLSVISVILESVSSLMEQYRPVFRTIEWVTVIIFSIEYALRIWTCTLDARYAAPVTGRLKFAVTPMALIDLAAVLPFYLPFFVRLDLRFLRAVRLVRLLRIFKLGRYSSALQTLGTVFTKKREELLVTLFVVAIVIILASSVMYFVENQTGNAAAFSSIPSAMWWAVVTLTTIGYGDMYPTTPLGKFLGAVIALLGIGVIALPTAILGSAFVEELRKKGAQPPRTCPHCGKPLE